MDNPNSLIVTPPDPAELGESAADKIALAANAAASANTFLDFMSRRAPNTLRRQRADLALFARFLETVGIPTDAYTLQTRPTAWRGITWGLLDAFVK